MVETFESFARRIEDNYRAHGEVQESEVEISGEQFREAAAAGLQASSGSKQA